MCSLLVEELPLTKKNLLAGAEHLREQLFAADFHYTINGGIWIV